MTDLPPRRITGLSPRPEQAPLARLLKSQRDQASTVELPTVEPTPDEPTAPEELPGAPAVVAAPARPSAGPASADDINVTVTIRLPTGLRNRSRAAFQATRLLENDDTYSDMFAKALEAEVRRREGKHHEGQPYTGGEAQLTSGRPFTG